MPDYQKHLTLHPDQRSGQPGIRGLRITVYDILIYLAAGDTTEDVSENFPMLTKKDILACLAYAADTDRKSRITSEDND